MAAAGTTNKMCDSDELEAGWAILVHAYTTGRAPRALAALRRSKQSCHALVGGNKKTCTEHTVSKCIR